MRCGLPSNANCFIRGPYATFPPHLVQKSADLFLHDLLTNKQSENITSLGEVITIMQAQKPFHNNS